jgi:hypothetical protein
MGHARGAREGRFRHEHVAVGVVVGHAPLVAEEQHATRPVECGPTRCEEAVEEFGGAAAGGREGEASAILDGLFARLRHEVGRVGGDGVGRVESYEDAVEHGGGRQGSVQPQV